MRAAEKLGASLFLQLPRDTRWREQKAERKGKAVAKFFKQCFLLFLMSAAGWMPQGVLFGRRPLNFSLIFSELPLNRYLRYRSEFFQVPIPTRKMGDFFLKEG